jgi:hypothetical protein
MPATWRHNQSQITKNTSIMSRFNLAIIATVFASFFFVSCEKEEFTPNTTAATTKFSATDAPQQLPYIFTDPVEERAQEVLAELQATPVFTAPGTRLTVVPEMPTEKNMRYVEMLPEMTSEGPSAKALNIDCPYGDCEATVPALVAKYQDIATTQCVDQFLSITCCADGETVYVVVYIKADCMSASYR